MTAWQLVIQQLNTKHVAGNICERCDTRFPVTKKQTTKRFCTEACQLASKAERRKVTSCPPN